MNEAIYEEQIADSEPMIYEQEPIGFAPQAATKWQFIWLCGLVLSFCYEIAIVEVTTLERINPRLFDFAFIIGILTVLPVLRATGPLSKVFKRWAGLVAVFTTCALIWTVWLPLKEIGYSLFYTVKYLEGLLAMYMVAKIPLTPRQKKIIHGMVIVGGIVVATYAIPQYLGGGARRVLVESAGKEAHAREGQLFSCLGPSYFHVAWFCSLSSVMALVFFQSAKTFFSKLACLGLGLFVAWPAFFSGARSGVAMCLASWITLFILSKASFKTMVIVFVVGLLIFGAAFAPKMLTFETLVEKSSSLQRLIGKEEAGSGGTITQRLTMGFRYTKAYAWQGWRLPFIGGAFYVVAVKQEDGSLKFRHAYGIHNMYLFPLEQGGIAAFILFFAFLVQCWKDTNKMRRSHIKEDVTFAVGMQSYFVGMCIVGLVGGCWLGVSTANYMFYVVILFILASKASIDTEQAYYLSELQ
jgi:hypothetical protein